MSRGVGLSISPLPLNNSQNQYQLFFSLSLKDLGKIISLCICSFLNLLSGLHASDPMCNIFGEYLYSLLRDNTVCRFLTVFFHPKQTCHEGGSFRVWFLPHYLEGFHFAGPSLVPPFYPLFLLKFV